MSVVTVFNYSIPLSLILPCSLIFGSIGIVNLINAILFCLMDVDSTHLSSGGKLCMWTVFELSCKGVSVSQLLEYCYLFFLHAACMEVLT